MSSEHVATPDLGISPLTFLQTYQSAGVVIEALLERDVNFQHSLGSSAILRFLLQTTGMPLYYHWVTSGYMAHVDEMPVGWLYIRGWRQVIYIETLAVRPDWRRRGIGSTLLDFAEQQANELHREWLGLSVTPDNLAAVTLYEKRGFHRSHWHIMQCSGELSGASRLNGTVSLSPLVGPAAWQAYRRFAQLDLKSSGDCDTRLIHVLLNDPYWQLGQHWLVRYGEEAIAYLNKHGPGTHPTFYLACASDWWGSPPTLEAIKIVLNGLKDNPSNIDVRLGSSRHHDAIRPALEQLGFAERSARKAWMFKHLTADDWIKRRPSTGGREWS